MSNNSLKDYLTYYTKLEEPGYAVLITGEWGAGKTHQVLKCISKDIRCHISLFGINNTNEIYTNIYAKMFPGKDRIKKATGMIKEASTELNGVTFGAGGIIGSAIDSILKEEVDTTKIIIFDDLERCSLTNGEIFGAINKYVEHYKCHVIVLAHDEKTQKEFNSTKEKLIGHTIKITPEIEDAAIAFFSETSKLNTFNIVKDVIIRSFRKTKCQSLRILKHAIKDCERLRKCLEIEHIRDFEAMEILFTNFTILNVEYRSGNLTSSEIKDIPEEHQMFSFNRQRIIDGDIEMSESQKRSFAFFNKYDEEDLIISILGYDITADLLESGYYNKEIILEKLNTSKYFLPPEESPAWLTILNFDQEDESNIKSAIEKINQQFKNREITELGEMLHLFHVLYLLCQNNLLVNSYDSLYLEIINYIDDLLAEDRLIQSSLVPHPFDDDIYERSHGHSYWVQDEYRKHIDDIIIHLKTKRYDALISQFDDFKYEILDALENDYDKFKSLFLGNGIDAGKYAQVDILKTIPVDDFIMSWFSLPREKSWKVRMVLNSRYRNITNTSLLINEKQWLYDLCLTLKIEALTQHGLDRLRVERLIPYTALSRL